MLKDKIEKVICVWLTFFWATSKNIFAGLPVKNSGMIPEKVTQILIPKIRFFAGSTVVLAWGPLRLELFDRLDDADK